MRASSRPRDASSTNTTAMAAREQPAHGRVVADVGRDTEQDDLLRVEQLEQPVRVRVREHVEVLLQQQELAARELPLRHVGERQRDRVVLQRRGTFSAPRVPRRQCGG